MLKPINVFTFIIILLFMSACSAPPAAPAVDHVDSAPTPRASRPSGRFKLTSPVVAESGALPKEFTCDGASATLPLAWSGAPDGTRSFAVIMHHIPGPGDSHWYWVLYNIPADVQSLPENVTGVGTLGNNSVNGRLEYAPPCSKGPGAKTYTYTVYALSAAPHLDVAAGDVTRNILLAAISAITLDSAELSVTYSR
jgi:Raf kinase inhibitor-like YbhB/YbcL family protein